VKEADSPLRTVTQLARIILAVLRRTEWQVGLHVSGSVSLPKEHIVFRKLTKRKS